jgi:hypothetical protein
VSPLHRPRAAALGVLAAAALATTLGLPSVPGVTTASAAPAGAATSTSATTTQQEPEVADLAEEHQVLQPETAAVSIGLRTSTAPLSPKCTQPGTSGNRIQAVYAYYGSLPNRIGTLRPYVIDAMKRANGIVAASARQTGGSRQLRIATSADCQPSVAVAHLSSAAASSFARTASELTAKGYTHSTRKYLVFADARSICGLGQTYNDDQPGPKNRNNRGPQIARVDLGCWSGSAAAHEIFHTLGAVQKSAPHSDTALHCRDEKDLMCYSGAAGTAVYTASACRTTVLDERLDCNKDDYFHTSPRAGSYLATHWNTARSSFLWGGGPASG